MPRPTAARLIAALEPLALFVLVYATLLWLATLFGGIDGLVSFHHWGLAFAAIATAVVTWHDRILRGEMRGAVRPERAWRGALAGFAIVASSAALLVLTGSATFALEASFPWPAVLLVILPAALHEELVFRGAPFSALRFLGDRAAVLGTAALFAALHGSNEGVSAIALTAIFLGGCILGLVRVLWGLGAAVLAHFAWNLTSGPLLGFPVSGWEVPGGVLSATPHGPHWWSGGTFGLEGGLAMMLVLLSTVIVLERSRRLAARDKMHTLADGDHPPPNPQETGPT